MNPKFLFIVLFYVLFSFYTVTTTTANENSSKCQNEKGELAKFEQKFQSYQDQVLRAIKQIFDEEQPCPPCREQTERTQPKITTEDPTHIGANLSTTTIQSPSITNWGDWGEWEACNSGTYVLGFQLKTEKSQGGEDDDTALNGIELQCATIGSTWDDSLLHSKLGQWGDWGQYSRCPVGSVLTGFQLRVEPSQGGDVDDTATNNLMGFCSSANTCQQTDSIVGDGLTWGDWSARQDCPSGYGICGMRTQVEPWQESGDDTSLNNVAMQCCPLPPLSPTPKPPTCIQKARQKCEKLGKTCTGCYKSCIATAITSCQSRA